MALNERDLDRIRAIANRLAPYRKESAIVDDMFERADDLRSFGESLICLNEQYDYIGRAEQEAADSANYLEFYGDRIAGNPDYLEIFAIGERFIAEGRLHPQPPDGYLRYKPLILEIFDFVRTEYGMQIAWDDVDLATCESPRVKLSLGWPSPDHASVSIARKTGADHDVHFLEQVLWRGGRREPFLRWPDRPTTTEAARAWFEQVAAILKQYARDLLADEPGAFESLEAAAAEWERENDAECTRLYIEEHGHPPPDFGT